MRAVLSDLGNIDSRNDMLTMSVIMSKEQTVIPVDMNVKAGRVRYFKMLFFFLSKDQLFSQPRFEQDNRAG